MTEGNEKSRERRAGSLVWFLLVLAVCAATLVVNVDRLRRMKVLDGRVTELKAQNEKVKVLKETDRMEMVENGIKKVGGSNTFWIMVTERGDLMAVAFLTNFASGASGGLVDCITVRRGSFQIKQIIQNGEGREL